MSRRFALVDPSDMWPGGDLWDNFMGRGMKPTDFSDNELEMYEDDDNIVVKLKAPGFNKDNVELTIEDNVLTIAGKVKKEKEEKDEENKKKRYYYKEMVMQSFTRSVRLPVRIKPEEASAAFNDGLIQITMPKSEEAKPQKVQIKTE